MAIEPVWGAPIAWYLFLAGLGAGAFIAAAFLRWRMPDAVGMRRVGHIVGFAAVAAGLVLLMFDAEAGLHNPLRFALLLTNFGSVMTWGVVFLGAFAAVAFAMVVLDFMKKAAPAWIEAVGAAAALCVAAYTGALLGVCNTYPLWNNALLPVLFAVSALSSGIAAVLFAGALGCAEEFDRAELLKKIHFVLPIVEIALVASLCFITAFDSPAGLASVMSLTAGEWAIAFWAGLILVGLVAPIAIDADLLFFASKEFEHSRPARLISAGACVGVLVGGFLLRFLVVMAALPVTFVM